MATGTKYPADVGVQVEKNTKDINTLNQKTQRGAYVYSKTKELNDGEDLNNCVDLDTMYYQSVDTSVENGPPLNGFSLFNIRNNWGIMQEAVYYVDAKTYRRMEFNGTWSGWRELSDMSDSGWLSITTEYQPIHYRKVGKLVHFYFWNDKAIPASTTIAQLPEGYRPKLPFYPNAMFIRDTFAGNSKIAIKENGLVVANSEVENTNWTFFYTTWLV